MGIAQVCCGGACACVHKQHTFGCVSICVAEHDIKYVWQSKYQICVAEHDIILLSSRGVTCNFPGVILAIPQGWY